MLSMILAAIPLFILATIYIRSDRRWDALIIIALAFGLMLTGVADVSFRLFAGAIAFFVFVMIEYRVLAFQTIENINNWLKGSRKAR